MQKAFVWIFLFALSFSLGAGSKSFTERIDETILKKMLELKQNPQSGISDETFCRRVYLSATGRIPTLQETRLFLADKNLVKREKLINKLLNSRGYVSHFSNIWGDLLRITYTPDKLHSPMNYMEYVKEALRKNKKYDVIVRELLSAEGELYKPGNGQTGFYAREVMQLDHMSSTVKAFLGMSIECAQCHDHPFDDWTQKEFYELAAFTTKVDLRVDPVRKDMQPYDELNKSFKPDFDKWIVLRESLRMKHASILGNGTGYIRLPDNYKYDDAKPNDIMTADVLFGAKPTVHYTAAVNAIEKSKNSKNVGPAVNAKSSFAAWITSRENEMFVKNIVNRLWYETMGSELIGPLTQLELASTGSHPELTKVLTEAMLAVDFDMKEFLKIIFNTKAYQSKAYSVQQNDTRYLFDGPVVARLSAENIWDSLLSIAMEDPDAGLPDNFKHDGFTYFYELSQTMGPMEFEAYILKNKFNRSSFYNYNHKMAEKQFAGEKRKEFMRASEFWHPVRGSHPIEMFGQSTREIIDGQNLEPNIPQTLLMINGDLEKKVIRDEKNNLNKNIESAKGHNEKLGVIFLSIFNRQPGTAELERLKDFDMSRDNINNLVWAMINSNEFKFRR